MIWLLLLVVLGALVWFLFHPRRFQTIENVPSVVDEKWKAHDLIETTEDPREVRPIAEKAAHEAGDRPVPGHGDSLTFDWRQDPEPHDRMKADGPETRT